jgi:hypothetical protein
MPWQSFRCAFDIMTVATRKLISILIGMIASERKVTLYQYVWLADTAVKRSVNVVTDMISIHAGRIECMKDRVSPVASQPIGRIGRKCAAASSGGVMSYLKKTLLDVIDPDSERSPAKTCGGEDEPILAS